MATRSEANPTRTRFRKGVVLAGGSGTRLYPITQQVSKQLLPVFDKPMIYYPLSTLMLAGIREYLIVCAPQDVASYQQLLLDGTQLGLDIQYVAQDHPKGIAHALLLGEEFIAGEPVSLVLGDNIFYGQGLQDKLQLATSRDSGATIYCYQVKDPQRYGVVEFDDQRRPKTLVEKPTHPKSNQAVTGLYFYDSHAVEFASQLQPSARGELEITDLNRIYLERGMLHVETFGRGFAWLDTGTETSLLQAANFVETVQERQGLRIACIEEVAYRMGLIDRQQVAKLAEPMGSSYGDYLRQLVDNS